MKEWEELTDKEQEALIKLFQEICDILELAVNPVKELIEDVTEILVKAEILGKL